MRELPPNLVAALRAARKVEGATEGLLQERRAIEGTSLLMLAAVRAGWTATELAAVTELKVPAAQKRVFAAKQRVGETHTGLVVERAAVRQLRARDRPAVPVEERDWLTTVEAAAYSGQSRYTIRRWWRDGLLPNTDRSSSRKYLHLRADLQRVIRAPRWPTRGVDREAVREQIRQSAV